jgi:hypothetical protein
VLKVLYSHRYPDAAALVDGDVGTILLLEEDILQLLNEDFHEGLRATLRLMRADRKPKHAKKDCRTSSDVTTPE